jgi:hypothetical protein
MEDLSHLNSNEPYGWMLPVVIAARIIGRLLRASPGVRDERAAALEFLDVGLNQPSGPR